MTVKADAEPGNRVRRRRFSVAALMLGLIWTPAGAAEHQPLTGAEMWDLCGAQSSYEPAAMGSNCLWYIKGYFDGRFDAGPAISETGGWCPGTEVTSAEMVGITLGFLSRNMERHAESATELMADAWREAFPCP